MKIKTMFSIFMVIVLDDQTTEPNRQIARLEA